MSDIADVFDVFECVALITEGGNTRSQYDFFLYYLYWILKIK